MLLAPSARRDPDGKRPDDGYARWIVLGEAARAGDPRADHSRRARPKRDEAWASAIGWSGSALISSAASILLVSRGCAVAIAAVVGVGGAF